MTPIKLPCGYYRVRSGDFPRSFDGQVRPHWLVARWMPEKNHWQRTGGDVVPHNFFDSIAEKVA